METPTTSPPGRRGNPVVTWVKRNKIAATAIGAGAAFVFMTKKGQGGGEDTGVIDGELVPVATASTDESATSAMDYILDRATEDRQTASDRTDQAIEIASDAGQTKHDDAKDAADRAADNQTATETAPPPAPSSPTNTGGGLTIAGHFFSGATGSQSVGSGKDKSGTYVTHLITFPGRTERWRRYHHDAKGNSENKWVKVSSAGNPTASNPDNRGGAQPAPAPAPAPPPSPPPAPKPPANPVPSGWHNGLGGLPSNQFSAYGAYAYNSAGAGKTGHGNYTMYDIIFAGGSRQRWHYYTSGDWHGQWHRVN